MYFAICFHERVYINDIALGDHQLLIVSHANDRRLFNSLIELIDAGVKLFPTCVQ
jgi:hypothetical protein